MNGVALYDKVLEKTDILEMGKMLAQSGMFGVKTPAQGAVVALTCYTENISLTQFKQKYHYIEQGGTLSMRTDYILSEFYKRDGKVQFKENTDEVVDMVFINKQFPEGYPVKHTLKEFVDKKVATSNKTGKLKDNWAKHPANMLRARCVSDAIRVVDPEIIAGFYPVEVAQDFSEESSTTNIDLKAETPFTEAKVVEKKEALAQAKEAAQVGESVVEKAQEIMQENSITATAQSVEQEGTASFNELIVRMRRLLDSHQASQLFTDYLIRNNQIAVGSDWDNLQNVEMLQRAIDNPVKFIEAIGAHAQGGAA